MYQSIIHKYLRIPVMFEVWSSDREINILCTYYQKFDRGAWVAQALKHLPLAQGIVTVS